MERAGIARQEAERLAGALDVQTRALDEFSNVLPTRVGEAETVLRGVADRLYASEQLAREQAVNLSEKLSLQVDGLQRLWTVLRHVCRISMVDCSSAITISTVLGGALAMRPRILSRHGKVRSTI